MFRENAKQKIKNDSPIRVAPHFDVGCKAHFQTRKISDREISRINKADYVI